MGESPVRESQAPRPPRVGMDSNGLLASPRARLILLCAALFVSFHLLGAVCVPMLRFERERPHYLLVVLGLALTTSSIWIVVRSGSKRSGS